MDNLFSVQEREAGFEFIGNGLSLKKTTDKDVILLYKNGQFLKRQQLTPAIEKRSFVVDLVERQGATKSKLAASLGVSRQSIDNWVNTYQKNGMNGLVNNTKDSWKKNPKRFTGNKARELERERREKTQQMEKNNLEIDFSKDTETPEEHCGQARELYGQEFDYQKNRYGGSMLYLAALMSKYNFLNLLSSLVGDYLWIPLMFVMMHVNRIFSVEQFKTAYKKEFGQILGLKKLPNLVEVRTGIWGLVELEQARKGMGMFFKSQIINGTVSIWRIFLDGHLVPYSGKEKVHKAHSTQRSLMMPGQTEFFAHDSGGNIVYFDIQEGRGDMMDSMRKVSSLIKPYNNGTPPLVVVDRELWGVERFLSISDLRFVTWEKNCNKAELAKLAAHHFSGNLKINDKAYRFFETEKAYHNKDKGSVALRRIIVRNTKTGETFAVVSNDTKETTKTIVDSMLNRWGNSENGFKHLGSRTNMHYNPAWNTKENSKDQTMVNPEHTKLKKELKGKKTALAKLQKELGQKELSTNKDGSIRKSTVREKKISKRNSLEIEIREISKKVSECPQRTNTIDEGIRAFMAIDNQGKKWWNIAEMVFWNSRKKLSKMLYNYLPDNRDLLPVLDAITSSKGWVKSTKNTLTVRLEPLETPRFRDAQIQLCRHLNSQNIKLPNGKLLQYDVKQNPYSVQK